ncbi:protein of unknown function [Methylococcus capsulatus]|uniref:Uncharacterized protein n=1 Tax=Methylococcus capsulatus TaxID=414 RepID=A0AA35UPZ5_METCP|nr:protein of unknown function [Methylococcus capsulatus]
MIVSKSAMPMFGLTKGTDPPKSKVRGLPLRSMRWVWLPTMMSYGSEATKTEPVMVAPGAGVGVGVGDETGVGVGAGVGVAVGFGVGVALTLDDLTFAAVAACNDDASTMNESTPAMRRKMRRCGDAALPENKESNFPPMISPPPGPQDFRLGSRRPAGPIGERTAVLWSWNDLPCQKFQRPYLLAASALPAAVTLR